MTAIRQALLCAMSLSLASTGHFSTAFGTSVKGAVSSARRAKLFCTLALLEMGSNAKNASITGYDAASVRSAEV
jgi:hypothetical protein